jgi:hypothetical protein
VSLYSLNKWEIMFSSPPGGERGTTLIRRTREGREREREREERGREREREEAGAEFD